MQTFIRLCLCILLGIPAAFIVVILILVSIESVRGYAAYRHLANTTCAQFVEILRAPTNDPRNELFQTITLAASADLKRLWDEYFNYADIDFENAMRTCLAHPDKSLNRVLIGRDPSDAGSKMAQTFKRIEVSTSKDKAMERYDELRSELEAFKAAHEPADISTSVVSPTTPQTAQ